MRPPRPERVFEQDVAFEPDSGNIGEAITEVSDLARAIPSQIPDRGEKHQSERDADREQPAAAQQAPIEDIANRNLIDALADLLDGLRDHLPRIAILLGLIEIGEFDRGDQFVAEQLGESPLEHQRQRVGSELAGEAQDLEQEHDADEPGHADQHQRPKPLRQDLDQVEAGELEAAVIEHQPDPEPGAEQNEQPGNGIPGDIAADRAAKSSQRRMNPLLCFRRDDRLRRCGCHEC